VLVVYNWHLIQNFLWPPFNIECDFDCHLIQWNVKQAFCHCCGSENLSCHTESVALWHQYCVRVHKRWAAVKVIWIYKDLRYFKMCNFSHAFCLPTVWQSKACCLKLSKSVSDVCESLTVISVELEVTVRAWLSYFFTCDLCHFPEPAWHIF